MKTADAVSVSVEELLENLNQRSASSRLMLTIFDYLQVNVWVDDVVIESFFLFFLRCFTCRSTSVSQGTCDRHERMFRRQIFPPFCWVGRRHSRTSTSRKVPYFPSPPWAYFILLVKIYKRSSVTVFWVILSIDKIAVKLKETWK